MTARGRHAALLAAALVCLGAPATGLGHAELRDVELAPGGLRLVLSAPVEEAFLRVEVAGAGGVPTRVDPLDPRAALATLPVGSTREVTGLRALSRDGHVTDADGASDDGPLAVLARLLLLIAPAGMLGLVALAAGVVGPAVLAGGVAPPRREAGDDGFRDRAGAALDDRARAWWRAWWILAAAGAAGLALMPTALLRALGEGPTSLGALLIETRVGVALWAGAAAWAVAVIAGLALRRRGLPTGAVAAVALGLPPAAALAVISWAGHASSGGDRTANIVIDALHNAATAAWLGGLLGLAVLALPAARALAPADRVRLAAGVVVRFSALALTAVAVLVVTGVYRALAELGSAGEILDSDYGRVLLVKLGLFALLLTGGAYNRLVAHPRLERAALGLDPDDRGAAGALRVSVTGELVLASALMVSVAVLISLPPPG